MRRRERTNDPSQTGLDGRCIFVEVLTVKTHTGLEAKTVASAEACKLHGRF